MDLKYLKHVVFYFVTAVISVILIYYACYHLFDGFQKKPVTMPAEKVTQSRALTLEGYLIRDEQYVYSSVGGEIGYLFSDGDKVAADVAIAQVYALTNPEVRARIMALDEEIAFFRASNEVAGVTASDTTVIDREIARLHVLLKDALNKGDAEYVYRKQNELLILLNQRRIITRKVDSYNSKLSELLAEKERLTASLSGVTATVRSKVSGTFYSTLDGYEEAFSTKILDTLTVERFDQLIQTEPMDVTGVTENGYRIGKLVTDYKWYIACKVERDLLREFTQGSSYSMSFPYSSDVTLPVRLTSILSSLGAGEAVLIFETGVSPESFHYLRMQTVNIIQSSYEGYRVPISAVRVVNGVQGVYVLQGNYVRFRAIEPIYEDGGYLLVSCDDTEPRSDGIAWLGLYEEIITEGKNLYDGKIIR